MESITRWEPFKELEALENRLATLFGRVPIRKDMRKEEAMTVAEWAPLVDIVEDPGVSTFDSVISRLARAGTICLISN